MITTYTEREGWNAAINSMPHFDFYHTFDYHQLSKGTEHIPILLVYKEGHTEIVLPILLRRIEDTGYFDVTSVYGYAGPLCKNLPQNFDNARFCATLRDFFIEWKVVTVFSRLSPFIPNQIYVLKGIGEIQDIGRTVNIDITQNLNEQWHAYHHRLRSHVNRTKASCTIKKATTANDLEVFIDLYLKTMSRVKAENYYFFDKQYYFDLFNSNAFNTEILFCVDNATQEILGGVMFISTNGIVQYHLSATKDRYHGVYPTKYIINHMRLQATERGMRYLNLGGGLGGAQDTLFDFKASFSGDFKIFSIWKWVCNEQVNQQLIESINNRYDLRFVEMSSRFFPIYRIKIAQEPS